jgi:hypothetical protein
MTKLNTINLLNLLSDFMEILESVGWIMLGFLSTLCVISVGWRVITKKGSM